MVTKLEDIIIDSTGRSQTSANPNATTATPYNGPAFKQSATDVQAKIRTWQETNTGSGSLVFPQESIKYFMNLQYSKYTRLGASNQGSVTFNVGFSKAGDISLPLPTQGMVDNHEVEYEEVELGIMGAGATAAQNLFGGGSITNSQLATGIGQVLGSSVVNSADNSQTGGLFQSLAGVAPNKFMTILLKGPKYKRHSFTWRLVPSTLTESQILREIVIKMNNAMAVGLAFGGLLWDFPYIWYIQYKPNASYLYKFKPMVLESLSTNYVPGGTPSFYQSNDAIPEAIELRANFLELEYWLRNQFDAYGGDNVWDNFRGLTGPQNDLSGKKNQFDQNVESILDGIGDVLTGRRANSLTTAPNTPNASRQ
jgi:hypothetical protein